MHLNFQLFKFDEVCQNIALTLCPLIGKYDGIEPLCYSRNVEFAGMLVFQPGKKQLGNFKRKKEQTQ